MGSEKKYKFLHSTSTLQKNKYIFFSKTNKQQLTKTVLQSLVISRLDMSGQSIWNIFSFPENRQHLTEWKSSIIY